MGVGPAGCRPRTWTALLRLDRAFAVGPSESAFQGIQRQPGGPSAARGSGCGGAGSGRWGCLGRRRTQGQRSRCPSSRPRTSLAWPAARPGMATGRAGLWAGPGRASGWTVGPVRRQRCPSRSDKGAGSATRGPGLLTASGRYAGAWEPKCPESARTPRPSQHTPSDSLEPC